MGDGKEKTKRNEGMNTRRYRQPMQKENPSRQAPGDNASTCSDSLVAMQMQNAFPSNFRRLIADKQADCLYTRPLSMFFFYI